MLLVDITEYQNRCRTSSNISNKQYNRCDDFTCIWAVISIRMYQGKNEHTIPSSQCNDQVYGRFSDEFRYFMLVIVVKDL
jgi:hypothetical protein